MTKLMLSNLIIQLNALLTVVLKLQGIVSAWTALQNTFQKSLTYILGKKKNLYLHKLKAKNLKRLQRKKRMVWVEPERTDLWWQNMINEQAPEELWKKISGFPRTNFMILLNSESLTFHRNFHHLTIVHWIQKRN